MNLNNSGVPAETSNVAPKPKQEPEMWVVNIENEVNRRFTNVAEPSQESTNGNIPEEKPSIYPSYRYYNTYFPIGYALSKDCLSDKIDIMLDYVAFMVSWFSLDINSYLTLMKQKEDLVRGHYHQTFKSDFEESEDFLRSLLLASCSLSFAIILFQKSKKDIEILKEIRENNNDPTNQSFLQFSVLRDRIIRNQMETKLSMLNMSNQIPWLAVEAIFTNSNLSQIFRTHIERLAMSCFDDLYPRMNKSKVQSGSYPSGGFKHILHIFHWSRTPEGKWLADMKSEPVLQSATRFADFYIPRATDLLGSATSFKRLDGGSIDVKYSNKRLWGLMKISPLHMFSYSRYIYTTLLTFEQHYLECGVPVTAYVTCMKNLLQTNEDVTLLKKNGILQSIAESEETIMDFVRMLGNFSESYIPNDLRRMSDMIIEHHESSVSIAYSEFKSQFFPNRWVVISVFGAFALFGHTIIQTIYTVLGYYKA